MTAEKILSIARAEIGTKESPPNSNCVKYNTAYYGRAVSGSCYAWCAAFVWWCFKQANASKLFYDGKKTAYCPTLMNYHKNQAVKDNYKPGDVIFFNFNGKSNAAHVGICESFDGSYITTIDGNTGTGNEANGGAVMRRKRHKKYIVGAYRPNYEEEINMTEADIRKIIRDECAKIEAERANAPVPDWARKPKDLYAEVVDRGITDGSRPMAYATRLEAALMINAATK